MFYLCLLVIFWGSTFALTKYALDDFSPLWIVSLRLSIGFVIIYCILKLRGETLPTGIVNWAWLALIGMTAFFPFFLICWGTQYLDTNIGGILFGIGPLFTVLAAHFLVPNEKLNRLKLFGVIIGFAGLYILLFEKTNTLIIPKDFKMLSQIAILIAAIGYKITGNSYLDMKYTYRIYDEITFGDVKISDESSQSLLAGLRFNF